MQQVLHVKWVRISTCVSQSSKLSCVVTGGGGSIDQTEKKNICRRVPIVGERKRKLDTAERPLNAQNGSAAANG